MNEDLNYVLTSGPWVIANQYLVAQRWKPNFVPGEDSIQSMSIWVRLSKLPMEWMDSDLLWNIGGMLGKMCKVDLITKTQACDRFARICVEIDISKPLLGALSIDDRSIRVEYESLGLVCFTYGRYGHSKDNCREGLAEPIVEDTFANDLDNKNAKEYPMYGPWLLVSYGKQGNRNFKGRNRRMDSGNTNYPNKNGAISKVSGNISTRKKDNEHANAKAGKNYPLKYDSKIKNSDMANNLDTNKGSGFRFDILNEEVDIMMAEGEAHTKSKPCEDKSLKNKAVLTDITNQSSKHGEFLRRVSFQNNTKTTKKLDKPSCSDSSPRQLVTTQGGVGSFKGKISNVIEFRMTDDWNYNKSDVQNEINFDVVASKVKLQVVTSTRHCITALVDANPCVTTKGLLWTYLDAISKCFALPCLIAGDFNEIANTSKKRGGRASFSNSGFIDWIGRNNLVDLGFTGPKFTWMTKRGIGEEI
ncbi:hypothetical protein Dsin_021920 [Dipteronia sinensis]|uniref:DUF4283 domain-containing protein n=1 Tax=Dipteronia sinensis TaxID=43782 RepID=A0AAE0DZ87_9ROSI|nr:hypothetical protein Dsin_021920 [Dipteronia sinensis]